MAAITAGLVKELRDLTSVGMMDCKKALTECDGDIEKAVDWLRQKGLSSASKKAGRATFEGLIGHKANADNTTVAIVEVKCETDFVSRGDQFKQFAADMASVVYDKEPADDAVLSSLVTEALSHQIATLGENMSVGRFCRMVVEGNGVVGSYIHTNGKLGALVEVGCKKPETAKNPALLDLARSLAMQVTAASPLAVSEAGIDAAVVEREREVSRQKTLEEGKPANIVDKIVEGRIKKFYQEVCLLDQAYIRDDKMTIRALIEAEGKKLDDELSIVGFIRMQLGEAE